MDIVTQNQETLQCEVLTENVQTVKKSSGHSVTEPKTVQCEVLTDSGKTLEDSNGQRVTETTDGIM